MKIGFLSLGCPKNLVDGEVMLGMAREAGHEITSDASDAEVLVVNTCAFIDSAKQESIDAILEMAAQKRDGHCSRLVVTGCLAERYRDELQDGDSRDRRRPRHRRGAEDPGSNRGSGLGARDSAEPERLSAARSFPDRRSAARRVPSPRAPNPEPRAPDLHLRRGDAALPDDAEALRLREDRGGLRLHVRVLHHPDAARLVPQPDVRVDRRRGAALAERGVRELLLISQDTTFFGIDRGERGALGRLLRELNAIDGLTWIRLLYLYPTTITDDVLAAMADCEKVCRYIDLPLQHASADVLKRMRRPGNRRTYDKLLTRIRAQVPDVTLRTTLIVGFPGETDADFAELEGFVADTGVRSCRCLHLFARRRDPRIRACRRCPGQREKAATKCPHGASKEDSGARASGAHRI